MSFNHNKIHTLVLELAFNLEILQGFRVGLDNFPCSGE